MFTAISALSNFSHTAVVFIYNNCFAIIGILFAIIVLNAVRERMVAARKRRVMNRRANVKKFGAVNSTNTFDRFGKIEF